LTSLQNFLVKEWQRARAEKRGGGQTFIRWDEQAPESRYQLEAASDLTPDKIFEQRLGLRALSTGLGPSAPGVYRRSEG